MDHLTQALRGASRTARVDVPPLESALIVGAGGTLGSAILAEALVAGRFQAVAAVTTGPLSSALRGLRPLALERLHGGAPLGCELAVLVFERGRHSNGRDAAFHQPVPGHLVPLARALQAGGVRRLLVVVPHTAALLPQALKAGFATHDEAAVAALGFDHVVLVRAAQLGDRSRADGMLQRLASWWLSQLHWMIPQREQPVRAVSLAAVVVQLARRLAASPPGTRVLPPERVWQLAQAAGEADSAALLDEWLATVAPR
jgi:hypothetical protein